MLRLFKLPTRSRLDMIKKMKKLMPRTSMFEKFDPLTLPEDFDSPAVFQKLLSEVEKRRSFVINADSMATYTYSMAKLNVNSSYIDKEISLGFDHYKGKLTKRSALGFYYGSLGLNYSKQVINFARDEYLRYNKDEITYSCLTSS